MAMIVGNRSSAGSFGKADLEVKGIGSIQVKARKSFSIFNIFDGADKLVIKADRKELYIFMPLSAYLKERKEWKRK